jgi:hypothetical protein
MGALRSIAVVEPAKNQLLRDFRRRSIFDFCNTICQHRTRAPQQLAAHELVILITSGMIFTVIDDPGYRLSPSFREGHLWNLTEPQTFFFANEQRRRPGAASAEALRCAGRRKRS